MKHLAHTPLVLRVGPDGLIVAASASATATLGEVTGKRCADVLAATQRDGAAICSGSCALDLADREGCPAAVVHGRISELSCTRVGDETVVTLRPGRWLAKSFPDRLSPREREVATAIASGLTNRDIAAVLGVSPSTVRTHVEHLLARLGACTRAEAVTLARELGEIP